MLKQLLNGLALLMLIAFDDGFIASSAAAGIGYAPQISNERSIKISAAPQNISSEAKTWDFEVTLETHTQALKSSTLIADGVQYPPLSWEGAPPGGHHRKGLLHFKAIVPQPGAMELQIRLTGDKSPRSFKWLLK